MRANISLIKEYREVFNQFLNSAHSQSEVQSEQLFQRSAFNNDSPDRSMQQSRSHRSFSTQQRCSSVAQRIATSPSQSARYDQNPKISQVEQDDQLHEIQFDVSDENKFVAEQMVKEIQSRLCHCKFKNGVFIIQAPKDKINETELQVHKLFSELSSRCVKKNLDLSRRETDFFIQHLVKEKLIIENNHNCRITINQQVNLKQNNPDAQVALQINYQNKQFKIISGDILKLRSEAVVNTSNQYLEFGHPSMQTGVAKKIQQLGGLRYAKACKDYISKERQLQFGEVFPHHHNAVYIQYILTIATPFYQQGSKTAQDLQLIRQNIEAIFECANQLNLREITFPIIGGGTSGFQFSSAAEMVIGSVLEGLYSMDTTVMAANIIEIESDKVQKIIQITNNIISVAMARQSLQGGFEEFQRDESKSEIRIIFPFSKQPGTHSIDLSKKTLTDLAYLNVQCITLGNFQGRKSYFFGQEPVHPRLNEYIFSKQTQGIQQFGIFFKRHKVIFSKQEIVQINLDTNYVRQVKYLPFKKLQVQQGKCTLSGKMYQLQQFFLNDEQVQKATLTVEVIDINNFNRINADIRLFIRSAFTKLVIDIPPILDTDLNTLKQMIESDSLEIDGEIAVNKKVTVLLNRQVKYLIDYYIQTAILKKQVYDLLNVQKYPSEWDPQSQNLSKVRLSSNQDEYQKIQNLFAESDQGRIYEIYRIQNKILWENYSTEKLKLMNRYKEQNQELSAAEEEIYVWHGVHGQHPSVIYNSEIEAFDSSYSQEGYWGPGIYFAEKALYSRDYAYTLQKRDDAKYAGKQVFLCCLLTTGRINFCNSDKNLRRPPTGYDCVSGITGEGNAESIIYVLYQMQVRRAYPAYEVIFK